MRVASRCLSIGTRPSFSYAKSIQLTGTTKDSVRRSLNTSDKSKWTSHRRPSVSRPMALCERWFSSSGATPQEPNDQDKQPKISVYRQLWNEAWNIPNGLTIARLVSTPGLAYLIWIDQFELAIVTCFFTGILDWLDGYYARKYNQFTVLGSFLDPLADKVFVGMLLGTLTVKDLFPWQLAALVIGRDVALLGGSFIYRALTKPPGVEFFATTGQGVIEVKPTMISKVNTVLQMSVLGFALTKAAYGVPSPELFQGMCWVVAGTTVASAVSYANLAALRNRNKL